MRAYLAMGEPAEAARVYRRCRDMLSVQLGIPPSAETEAVFRSIYAR
jgi:DNA-binding SARP family transcriptional activator